MDLDERFIGRRNRVIGGGVVGLVAFLRIEPGLKSWIRPNQCTSGGCGFHILLHLVER